MLKQIDDEFRERTQKLLTDIFHLGKDLENEFFEGMMRRRSPVVDDARDEAYNTAFELVLSAHDLFRRTNEVLKNIK